jgi:hypothetical protein
MSYYQTATSSWVVAPGLYRVSIGSNEARVYAEDAFGGFLPQAGTASYVHWPESLARVDHALESGQVVSTAYDPMLGKLIVHAHDRETARRGLIAALDETAIMGLTTNAGFLRGTCARRPAGRRGRHPRRVGGDEDGGGPSGQLPTSAGAVVSSCTRARYFSALASLISS